MTKKIVLLLFSVFLLATYSTSSEVFNDELPPRLQLFVFAIGGYSPLAIMATGKGANLIRDMLKETDDAAFKMPSEQLQVPVTQLTEFVEKIEKLRAVMNLPVDEMMRTSVALVCEFYDIMQKYNPTELEKPSLEKPSLESFKLTLQKSGFEQLSNDFNEKLTSFMPKFDVAVDKYLTALSPNERVNEAEMIGWYKQFKSEPKLLNFVRFFDLYPAETIVNVAKHL